MATSGARGGRISGLHGLLLYYDLAFCGMQEIVRELRKQMSEARSLKDTSKPEFEEKLNRLKQLRDLRSGYMDKISVIKNNIKGLEYRTEVEIFLYCSVLIAWTLRALYH